MKDIKIIGDELKNIPWQDKPEGHIGVIWRHTGNPITQWNPSIDMTRIYNSAIVPYKGGFAGVFRADHTDGLPRLHLGFSNDGYKWEIKEDFILWKDENGNDYQPIYGYDPRVLKLEDKYYVVWCTDFGGAPTLGFGYTKDFESFIRLENIFVPANRNGVLFPRKINNQYVLLSRPSDLGHTPFGEIYLSYSNDLEYWGKHRKVMSKGASGWWQDLKIGGGPSPIETSEGWLMLYHGVCNTCNGYVYSMGGAILDLENPSKVLYRARGFLLSPEKDYETKGFVPNVVFPCSTLTDASTGRITIYYGAADTFVSVAYTEVNSIVKFIKQTSHLAPGDEIEMR